MAKLFDMEVDEFLRKSVSVEPLAINEEYVELPAALAYWNARYADALREHLKAKMVLDRTEAKLRIECREMLAAEGKVTESMIDAAVERHPDIEIAKLTSIEAEVEKVRISGVAEAVRAKKDMLISLGATMRAEMDGDPSIRKQHNDAEFLRRK